MRGQRRAISRRSPDGMVENEPDGSDGAPREVAQVVSLMPAAFPKGPIKVGESWIREMALPTGARSWAPSSPGKLHVTFRFGLVDARRRLGIRVHAQRRDAAGHGSGGVVRAPLC